MGRLGESADLGKLSKITRTLLLVMSTSRIIHIISITSIARICCHYNQMLVFIL